MKTTIRITDNVKVITFTAEGRADELALHMVAEGNQPYVEAEYVGHPTNRKVKTLEISFTPIEE